MFKVTKKKDYIPRHGLGSHNKVKKKNSYLAEKLKINNTNYKHTSKKVPTIPKRKAKKRKRNKIFFWFFITICTVVFTFSVYELATWAYDNLRIKEINDDLKDDTSIKKKKDEGELINQPDDKESDYWYYVGLPFYEVDFSKLLAKNKDTVAFIHMENTNINYPVVQTNNNDYYLSHAFDKSRNDAGWIFMDYRNNINNLSDNTVIYGHGRLDRTVFGSLKNALTKSWQSNKENYAIWLSTPKENMVFQIFSIYTIQSESYYITTSFSTPAGKQKWLDTMKARNQATNDTSVNINDKILTLSTCQNNEGGRIVVQAKLVKKQTR